MIAIIDYKIGNNMAVHNMLQRLGFESLITSCKKDIESSTHIILPGNGAFDSCMQNLRDSDLIPVLEEQVFHRNVPLLGICVGAQILGLGSEEGKESGLGWINMSVHRFPGLQGLRVPHMGWNHVLPAQSDHYLTEGMSAETRFYFVHSYYMVPQNPADVLLQATYGFGFAAGVANGNIAGVQFHPEKSHRFGKKLLNSFAMALP
jgi:glutamine amidotransferase